MSALVSINKFIASFAMSPLAKFGEMAPWSLVSQSGPIVRNLLEDLSNAEDFYIENDVAVHRSAKVEPGAILKGPLILGAGSFVAAGAYLRGGNWIGEDCKIGPGVELKSSFVFSGAKLAHFNFVGDSLIGEDANLEAGSIICNCRNERDNKRVHVRVGEKLYDIGLEKFGAVLGDRCRLGANSVVAPGALLAAGTVVQRAELLDHELCLK